MNSHSLGALPAWTYQSPDFLVLEVDTLFRKNWILAGHISQLNQPHSYLTFEGFGERVLIVHASDGALKAFHNVCRHRGAPLLEGSGDDCPMMLSCPFHGWTYNRNGDCVAIPASNTFDGIDISQKSLIPVELEVWKGFVFIRITSGGLSVAEQLAPVASLVAPYQTDNMLPLPGTAFRQRRPYNWKVIHDIDNEGYHVPVGHPSLQQLYGKQYTDELENDIPVSRGYLNSRPAKIWSVARYQSLLPQFDHLPDDNQKLWLYIGVFPNLVIGLYPESIEFYMTLPESVDSTLYLGARFGLPDQRREVAAARYLNERINLLTDFEDETYVRFMQSSLASSTRPDNCYSSLEQGVLDFHQRIQREIPVGQLQQLPYGKSLEQINNELLTANSD